MRAESVCEKSFWLRSAAKAVDLRCQPNKLLDVLQHASGLFRLPPSALTTTFSLDFVPTNHFSHTLGDRSARPP